MFPFLVRSFMRLSHSLPSPNRLLNLPLNPSGDENACVMLLLLFILFFIAVILIVVGRACGRAGVDCELETHHCLSPTRPSFIC